MSITRIRSLAIAAAAFSLAASAAAQSTSSPQKKEESLAEIARRARAQRERKATAQPLREFTNETIPAERFPSLGSSGTAQEAVSTTGASEGQTPVSSADAEKERTKAEGDLSTEKQKLDGLKKQLELLEREARLNKDTFFAKPDYANDKAGAAALAAQDAAIEAKKTEIQASEARVAELENRTRGLNERLGPRAEEPKTPEQTRDVWATRLRPLQDEVAQIEAELQRIRQESAAMGSSATGQGSFTGDRITQLEARRTEVRRQISQIEDDARRAGTLPIRP